eukprot:8584262-Alexandrium_andersonii.AAC.1
MAWPGAAGAGRKARCTLTSPGRGKPLRHEDAGQGTPRAPSACNRNSLSHTAAGASTNRATRRGNSGAHGLAR